MKEQTYKEFKCSVCGDPCVLRIFDTCNIAPTLCMYSLKHKPAWQEKNNNSSRNIEPVKFWRNGNIETY